MPDSLLGKAVSCAVSVLKANRGGMREGGGGEREGGRKREEVGRGRR